MHACVRFSLELHDGDVDELPLLSVCVDAALPQPKKELRFAALAIDQRVDVRAGERCSTGQRLQDRPQGFPLPPAQL
eukprot:CAMPEP_0204514526 /NCGR_PEP_ID=MMETSP0661-20131031/2115_1 /ASSEMBLY_ACC=CAM_ASM_000606 /TAXON_ID=109239 /ORGANISM="Alexandrium margalefi, Strain AMGDE01CS-322" /LENGTH=76 /DNA_ID=CAMNT_0051519773 /DNA_START=104 /DNA_END=334 /DNA_ORIENTATION=-